MHYLIKSMCVSRRMHLIGFTFNLKSCVCMCVSYKERMISHAACHTLVGCCVCMYVCVCVCLTRNAWSHMQRVTRWLDVVYVCVCVSYKERMISHAACHTLVGWSYKYCVCLCLCDVKHMISHLERVMRGRHDVKSGVGVWVCGCVPHITLISR
jgi:hypothetical protein